MSLYKSPKSPFYSYDFQLDGRRFHGSTKARNKKDAELVERQLRAKAKADIEAEKRTGKGPLTLDIACGRYWTEIGQHHAATCNTWQHLERLIEFFGAGKRVDEITDADVATLVSWRRTHRATVVARNENGDLARKDIRAISPATINRTTLVPLKALFMRARRTWRYQFPLEPVWKDHMLKVSNERVRELHRHEEVALEASVREDYAPWLDFARATGLRLNETLIRWDNVNWPTKTITTIGKGGRKVTTPITPEVAAILKPLIGHHPIWVFTYVATTSRRAQTPEESRVKGKRYPITYAGAKTQWKRDRKAAGLIDFRFHDIRHDTATRLLRETGSLKIVQRALNHTSITTTARYAHVTDDDLAEALSRTAKSRKKSRKMSRTSARKAA